MSSEYVQNSSGMIGTVLLGRYRIVRELAKGGMGVVYLARAEGAVGFVKPYVIKLVLPEHADNQRFIQMFIREANILSNLRHPGIVSVIELGEREEDGALVMVLEYVRGYHLGQWAKYVRLKKRTMPIDILLVLMTEVLDALHYAHTMAHPDGTPMHIVHRDISPSNILLDEDGRARLLDFGVARMRGGNQDYHTQVKGFVGKLMYSAPELFAEAEATAQSDCYSCAIVLHEILMGRNVFRGESQAATLNRVLNHKPELLEPLRPDLPKGLDDVLQKALAKNSEDRFADAHEFAAALRALQKVPENEVRARLSTMLKADFGQDMSEMLGLESLADRDEAWRRLSHHPLQSRYPGNDNDTRARTTDYEASGPPTARPRSNTGTIRGVPPPPIDVTAVRVPPAIRRMQESSRTLTPPLPPPELIAPHGASVSTAGHTPSTVPRAPGPPSRAARLLVAGLLVSGAALAGVVLALRHSAEPAPAASVPQIRVVTQTDQVPPAATVQPVPVVEAEDKQPASAEGPRRTPIERREKPVQRPDAVALTRAVRKQQGRIESCFAQHGSNVDALPAIQLEFDLAESGKLQRTRVLPATVGVTPLGKCLEKVASSVPFPAQGRSVSFAIPITASRSGAQ